MSPSGASDGGEPVPVKILSEEQFQFALQGISDGFWYWDIPSGEEWWSARFRELIGFSEEELPASHESWQSLLHPDERASVLEEIERCVAQGEAYNVEYRIRTKEDGYTWIQARGRSENGADGSPVRVGGSFQKITERREAEHDLRLYGEIMEHIAEGINLTRMDDGVMVYVNPSFEKVFGYSAGELTGQHVSILNASTQQDPAERAEEIIKSVREKGFWEGEIHNVKKDGTEFWSGANVVKFEHREYGTVLLTVQEDITERKKADESLRLSAQIIEHMAEGVSLVRESDGVMVYANPRFEEIYGYAPGELDRKHVSIINASSLQDPKERSEEIIRSVEDHGYWSGEIRNVKKDGTEIWSWANVAAFEHREYGKVMIAVQEDITERVEATSALRESRKRLQNILDGINATVGVFSTDGVLLEVNQTALVRASLSREEVLGKCAWDTYWWSYSEEVGKRLRAVFLRAANGETVRYDESVRIGELSDGRPKLAWIDVTFGPLFDIDGNVSQIVGSAVDITDRVKAEEERILIEEQMQHAQKLESLGVLAGGIAHDFNNLLAAILGNADLALNETSSTSETYEYISDIVTASERAAELCQQMLAYSGRGRFTLEPLDLNGIVHEMSQLLKTSIGKKVSLEYELSSELPAVVGDVTQIRQVVMNLVTNASEAIGESSGTILVSTGVRHCEAEDLVSLWIVEELAAGEYVYFTFSDTGSGMDSEHLEKIFDPFYTTKFTGRGLGLAAALGIVRGHHGTINVESIEGKGTTFTLLLPSAGCTAEAAEVDNGDNGEKGATPVEGVVLLVDDEPFVRATASSMLRKAGFRVLAASDGFEAIECYKEHRETIDCVLLDLTMPRMDGEETFAELRRLGCRLPILLCSGFNVEETAERFAGKDVAGFLQKPYRMEKFLAELGVALGS